jgi:putative membrane protein
MKFVFHWIIATLAILVASFLVKDVTVTLPSAAVAAVVLAALNLFIKPIITILTLPVTVLTLGLFSLVINALLIMFASAIVPGFVVPGFLNALLFALVMAVINGVFHFWKH